MRDVENHRAMATPSAEPARQIRRVLAAHQIARCGVIAAMAAALVALGRGAPAFAQRGKSHIPIVSKHNANSVKGQTYSGKILSLDLNDGVMNVNSRQGRDTEIFPIRKDIHVEGINGERINMDRLTPGTSVLIYYDQKNGQRTVKNIIVLGFAKSDGKEKGSHPS